MTVRALSLLLVAAVPLAGCAVGPDYRPDTPAALGVPPAYSVPGTATAEDLTKWWERFDDPLLQRLVAQAAPDNLDVAQAVARLRQAREQLVQARADFLPTLSGSGGYSRRQAIAGGSQQTQLPDGTIINTGQGSTNNFSLGLDANYQVDLFGGIRRSVEGARASYAASGYDYATVLVSSQAEIARNYILARAAQAQIANARASLEIQDDNLEIAGFRVQAGLVSSLDAEQARAQRAQTAATIPSLEASYNNAVSRLGVLTGQAPGALKGEMTAVRPIPRGPAVVGTGIPAETLRQRPDVRAAERSLAAATAQIGVTEAQLYPAFNLSGGLDTAASAIGRLTDIITGTLFAGLQQLIFDGGRTRAAVRAQRAAADAAFLNYKSTVLTSLEDVENAVVALRTAQARTVQFRIAFDAANNSAILARSQYRAGLTDFTTLNQTETQLLSARNSLTTAASDESTALVQLFAALGGGWDAGTVPTIDNTTTRALDARQQD
ncbi:efflux transporter outer membrane subunit [Sphingomonas yantingensis]|uniref:NodT family efflux transporter outer membrane factor (OMF) lipoprotein n=2 Tax=Sphingomonas TaxID=13687 RepID=A0A7W9EJD4_9SPHN|nr:efflux transporter outer membrane subunit [Sphingomonas yantingensis]MBB5700108.1 NodT family efflux transporter outer membrane factor (OMF) lipoprotein [Sphingomonas yantingensis]